MGDVHDYVQGKIKQVYALETPDVYAEKGITVVKASAELVNEHTVKLNQQEGEPTSVTAKFICIATGAQPRTPNVEGMFDEKFKDRVWNYQEIWDVKELPKKLAVLGGGPIVS